MAVQSYGTAPAGGAGSSRTAWRPGPGRAWSRRCCPAWFDTARDLADRETRCCAALAFTFTRHDDELHLDITVLADQQSVPEVLAHQATKGIR